jgi:hypothetical protein
MSRLSPGGRRLALACLLTALLAAAPAAAGTATLTVRARVVDGCQTRLPDLVPPQARRYLPEHVRDLVVHHCRREVHPRVSARWSAWPPARHRPTAVHWHRPAGQRGFLVTISY